MSGEQEDRPCGAGPSRRSESAASDKCAHILLAEDSFGLRSLICRALRRDGHQVTECTTGSELLSELAPPPGHDAVDYDLVISDERLPGLTGLEILAGVSHRGHHPRFILITAFGDHHTHARARELGALAVFDKPFEIETLCEFVREQLPTPRR